MYTECLCQNEAILLYNLEQSIVRIITYVYRFNVCLTSTNINHSHTCVWHTIAIEQAKSHFYYSFYIFFTLIFARSLFLFVELNQHMIKSFVYRYTPVRTTLIGDKCVRSNERACLCVCEFYHSIDTFESDQLLIKQCSTMQRDIK